jgi:hypothetical protein
VKGERLWRGSDECIDTRAASAFTEYSDAFRVAAEGVDVASDPVEGEALVEPPASEISESRHPNNAVQCHGLWADWQDCLP